MNIIAQNERYELKVDSAINRLYITIKGFWRTKDGYLEDLETACTHMVKPFRIHVDLTSMEAPRKDIGIVHEEAQKILMKHGLERTAEVQADNAITRMALKGYSDRSGMSKKVFFNHEEAKAFLDLP